MGRGDGRRNGDGEGGRMYNRDVVHQRVALLEEGGFGGGLGGRLGRTERHYGIFRVGRAAGCRVDWYEWWAGKAEGRSGVFGAFGDARPIRDLGHKIEQSTLFTLHT